MKRASRSNYKTVQYNSNTTSGLAILLCNGYRYRGEPRDTVPVNDRTDARSQLHIENSGDSSASN
jgi:hypothetical protein